MTSMRPRVDVAIVLGATRGVADAPVGLGFRQTRVIQALVLHSPLVGPSSVRRLAASLEERGWATTVPDLHDAIESAATYTARAVAGCGPVDLVIGHSGAGAFMPTVADHCHATMCVFVDAIVPDRTATFTPSARFIEFLDAVPTDGGRLVQWHRWWPEEMLVELVADEWLRQELIADIPRVPRSFYDEQVALPPSWWTMPMVYLQLSDAYDNERGRVQAWGWPTRKLNGGHLDLFVDPDLIADHICELVDHSTSSTG